MKEIKRGAEAVILLNDKKIVKRRVPKSYRHPKLDSKLRIVRTKSEAKILKKLYEKNIPVPKILETDNEETIEMEYIAGKTLAELLNKTNYKKIMFLVGEIVANIHDQKISHGDLTTSNMLLKDDKIYIIDFGLSFFTQRDEDMAVDLHLLLEALEAKHYEFFEDAFSEFEKGYKKYYRYDQVMERLKKVESRGKNKAK